mgnify:CR=1 FL=1
MPDVGIREELGPYKGKLSLEIRGKMFIPIAKINSISEGDKFKRGKNHQGNAKYPYKCDEFGQFYTRNHTRPILA